MTLLFEIKGDGMPSHTIAPAYKEIHAKKNIVITLNDNHVLLREAGDQDPRE